MTDANPCCFPASSPRSVLAVHKSGWKTRDDPKYTMWVKKYWSSQVLYGLVGSERAKSAIACPYALSGCGALSRSLDASCVAVAPGEVPEIGLLRELLQRIIGTDRNGDRR